MTTIRSTIYRALTLGAMTLIVGCGTATSDFEITNETVDGAELTTATAWKEFDGDYEGMRAEMRVVCVVDPQEPAGPYLRLYAFGYVKGEDGWEPAPDITPTFRLGSILASTNPSPFDLGTPERSRDPQPNRVSYDLHRNHETRVGTLRFLRTQRDELTSELVVANGSGGDPISAKTIEQRLQETERAIADFEQRYSGLGDLPATEALARMGPVWTLQPWFFTDTMLKIEVPIEQLAPVFDRCKSSK